MPKTLSLYSHLNHLKKQHELKNLFLIGISGGAASPLAESMSEVSCVWKNLSIFLREKELVIRRPAELIKQGYLNYVAWGPFLENAGCPGASE